MNTILFKLCIWWNVNGMSLYDALNYPYDNASGHPFEDARSEMSYMGP